MWVSSSIVRRSTATVDGAGLLVAFNKKRERPPSHRDSVLSWVSLWRTKKLVMVVVQPDGILYFRKQHLEAFDSRYGMYGTFRNDQNLTCMGME